MLEERTVGSDAAPASLQRYIYSNHLQSASLELDENADIISYEEYHPFGTTAYSASNTAINAVAKRYRYTGKERDEETGLYYHGARYYIAWLGRWSASDPINSELYNWENNNSDKNTSRNFISLCASSYEYAFDNPINFTDKTGEQPDPLQYVSRLLEQKYNEVRRGWNQESSTSKKGSNPELKNKEWRTFAIRKPFENTGGDFKYNSYFSTENLGKYAGKVNSDLFLGNKGKVHVNEGAQFILEKENVFANQRDLVNHLLGNFIYGKGPENIVFPENGKFSSLLKNSIAVGETLAKWSKSKDGDFSWGMDTRGQVNVAVKEGFTSLENFLGSVSLNIETLENGDIRVGIFNITSLTSGDLTKDFTPDFLISPLKSTTRNEDNGSQTEYSNISQYFSFTLTKEEATKIINHYSPPGNK